jgi:hypothetical protein
VVVAGSALALSTSGDGVQATRQAKQGELKAFRRAPTASDAVPRRAGLAPLTQRYGKVVASRRIATANGFRGYAALYLIRFKRHSICLINVYRRSAGGGCSRSRLFLLPKRVHAGSGSGFFTGVAGNEIARVAFVDRHWRLRPVRLTRDNGFLYVCRNRNGCIDVINAVNGYDSSGRRVWHEVWPH